jgi:glucose/arabinose dehydrogenase/fibronectin type 3 domain-containing protein
MCTLRKLGQLIAVAGIVVTFLACQDRASADTFTDSGFATERVATLPPFTLVGMAFAPDGRQFVWQKNGVVRVIKNGQLLPTPFIDLSAKVNTFDDRGFWGLAFDPQFASNGRVYLSYTFENAGSPNSSAPRTARLTRVVADPANPDVALPGSEQVILGSVGTPPCTALPNSADCIGSEAGSHTLGSLHFANDGTLFVGVGDGSDGDANSLRAQDLTSPNGKILRINPDGTAPHDNPFYDGTNSWRSRVWAYGLRNPFGFAIQPGTDEIYMGEVGWNTWEEVDHGPAGTNFGWPCYEGNGPQPFFQSNFGAQCALIGPVTPPLYTYDHSFGSAAIGGPFYTGSAYPAQYHDSFFFADYSGSWIQRVVFDAAHHPVSVQPFATDVQNPVNITLGPDGMLYYLSFTTGEVRRIRFNGPVAAASATTPTNGYSPLTVSFSSAGSSNPGGGSLSYLWDFGDGTTSTAANPTHTYTSSTVRTFTARLTVTSQSGASSTDTVTVTVGSTPPTPTIIAPADGTTVLSGQTVTYRGSATDPDQGTLGGSALSWTVLLHHNTHVHTFVGGTGDQGSFTTEDHGDIGTFSYEIVLTATDASGLKSSTSVNLPVGSDTSPPSDPAGLTANASGTSQVGLSWSPSTDNIVVAGYRVERCQGTGCTNFAEVGTPTATGYTDTGLAPSTTYRYRVRAVDPSGNLSGYSAIAEATTAAAPPTPPGLVGAWSFAEGIGTSAVDASGNGNVGTLVGASWTPLGRYGNALSFNGTSSTVRIADSASLDLTTAMTLSAWIQPTASQSGWKTILQHEADAYFLNASNSDGPLRPSGGGTLGGNTQYLGGPAANPVNAWTNVALTYDGATLRLYVNGTQVASRAATGAIQTTNSPLWIGGNSPYGEYFQGLIDEVRVYNRALTQADVQNDMNAPIVPTAGDTTPPSAPTGLSGTAVASRVDLTWSGSTDNVGVAGYRVERCQGSGCTNFAQIAAPTATSHSDTGLAASTTYRYQVRAVDGSGNLSGYSTIFTVSTPAQSDTTPPSAPTGLAGTPVGSSRIDLGWTASSDDVGVTGYRVERCQGAGCTNFAQVAAPTATGYSDTGLAASTTYRYQVRAVDAAGNLGPYSAVATVTTPAAADTTPPSAPTALSATALSTSRIDLGWTASSDNVSVAGYRVERCQGTSCTNFAQVGTPTAATYSNTGLLANTNYRFRVRAIDAAGNLSPYSAIVSGRTLAPDTTRPTAPTGLAATPTGPTQINLGWTASSDNVGVTGYQVERCQGAGCTSFAQVGTPTTTTYGDTGLAPSTTYRFRVRAVDAAGNLSTYSSIATATTPAVPDNTPPTAPTGLTATAPDSSQVGLSWTGSTDNVGVAGYRVERCQGAGCTNFAQIAAPTATSYSDTGVAPSTTYRYQVRAVDASGNLSGYSAIADATTAAAPATPPGLVGAWGFTEGVGTSTADASGRGNSGTLLGGTSWSTQGRYGSALSFNGTNGQVRVADSASLDLTTAMTLSAWIRPTASQNGWRTILQRQADAYFLNASNSDGPLRPSGGGTFGGNTQYLSGATASPVNAWTFVAFTYDGTSQRLYINGSQVASRATTGVIETTDNPLWIGGNSPYGEYFNGLIDEVRVYNRALSQADIQGDMNTQIAGS